LIPRDENERAALYAEPLYLANEAGIPNEKILVDIAFMDILSIYIFERVLD
jgi:hypothetical protein